MNNPLSEGASARLFSVVEIPAVIGLLAMMVHTVANALSRTFFDAPISGTLERVQYWYMPLVVLLGFVVAMHRSDHVWADMVFTRFPARMRPFVACGMSVICSAVCLLITIYSFTEAQHNRRIELTAGLTDISAWPLTYLVPIAFGIFAVQYAISAVKQLRGLDADAGTDEVMDLGDDMEVKR